MQEFLITSGGITSEQVTPNRRDRSSDFDTLNPGTCRDVTFSRRGNATTTGRDTEFTVIRPYNDGSPDDH